MSVDRPGLNNLTHELTQPWIGYRERPARDTGVLAVAAAANTLTHQSVAERYAATPGAEARAAALKLARNAAMQTALHALQTAATIETSIRADARAKAAKEVDVHA